MPFDCQNACYICKIWSCVEELKFIMWCWAHFEVALYLAFAWMSAYVDKNLHKVQRCLFVILWMLSSWPNMRCSYFIVIPFLSMKIQHVIISIFFSLYPMTFSPWASFLKSMVVMKKWILHCYLLEASTISIKLTMMVMLILSLYQICFQQGFYQSEIWVWRGSSTSCCKAWMTFLTTWGYDNPWCGFSTILGYESIACKG